MQEKKFAAVEKILQEKGCRPEAIISILQAIQEEYRYVPREVFPILSEKLGVSEANIYSVATFYENFSLEPKGKYVIKVCDGTACHVRNSMPILNRLRDELGLSATKKTTDDGLITVETVACLGACSLAPVMMVNDQVHPNMTPEKAMAVVEQLRQEG